MGVSSFAILLVFAAAGIQANPSGQSCESVGFTCGSFAEAAGVMMGHNANVETACQMQSEIRSCMGGTCLAYFIQDDPLERGFAKALQEYCQGDKMEEVTQATQAQCFNDLAPGSVIIQAEECYEAMNQELQDTARREGSHVSQMIWCNAFSSLMQCVNTSAVQACGAQVAPTITGFFGTFFREWMSDMISHCQ